MPRAPTDLLIAATTAALVAFCASRVNRVPPPPAPVPPPHAPALDEVIADVDLDTQSLHAAVESLAAKSRARFVIAPTIARPAAAAYPPPRQSFRGLPLGALLARVLDEQGPGPAIRCEVDGDTIRIDNAPAARERRLYSVRDLVADWRKWNALTETWRLPPPPPAPPLAGGGGGGGGLFGGGPDDPPAAGYRTDEEQVAIEVLRTLDAVTAEEPAGRHRVVRQWAGFLEIEATPEAHDRIARFLTLLSQGASLVEKHPGRR